jgi:GH25 family lysozyme M1 (1,4-beta-N-acetylmuramidase)
MRRILAALAVALTLLGAFASSGGAYSNGNLPESALAPIATGVKCDRPLNQLSNQAAAAFNSMALAAGQKLSDNGCDSAYRPYARQVYYRALWCAQGLCGNAAVPGTSNHGWGLAIDGSEATVGFIRLHGKRFCWAKTEAFSEWWHQNFTGCYHRPNPGTNLHSPTLRLHSGGPGQGVYVRKLQKLLRGHGNKTVAVDGSFGTSTAAAVRLFQRTQKLPVTGVASPAVWKRLRQPISRPVKTTPAKVPAPTHGAPAKKPTKPHKHPAVKPNKPAWCIDISSHQGNVNFKAVRGAGASCVITKATQGTTYVNPYFGRGQIRAIGAAHLVPGVYHYLDPAAGRTGAQEAAFFASTIGRAGYGKGFIMPVVDVEETELSVTGTCHYLGEFVHTLKRVLGEKPMIYGSPYWLEEHLAGCSFLNHYLLWDAHYGVSQPKIPVPWSVFALWQYTSTANVAGVAGGVDVSKVRGGRRALEQLRVRDVPRRVRKPPRAKVKLPLAKPRAQLRAAAPAHP